MDADTWRVQLASGDGLVVRSGRALLLALPKGAEQESFVDGLQASIDAAVHADPQSPGRRVARAVAGLVAGAADEQVPPLVVAAATDDGIALLLVGDVDVEVAGTDGTVESLTGRDAATWVDRVVRGEGQSVTARLGSESDFDVRSDLGSGAVRASGFRLLRSAVTPAQVPAVPPDAPEPQVDAPTAAADIAAPAFVAVSLTEPLPAEELAPLPTLEPAAPAGEGVQVQGIVCSRGHFNDPASLYCATCGISMVHQTHNLVPGQRPPLGVVVLDDGAVFPLIGDYVLGREPDGDAEVVAGRAQPLALDDPDALVSRVHARIRLEGWDVRVLDAHSSNGTFVARPGEADWTRLVADEPVTILPGTRVTLGNRSLVFDSYRKH